MMKRTGLVLLFFALALSSIAAQQKYALVIGNGAYTGITRLNNPVNDAADISAALRGLGFTVDLVINAGRVQMEEAVTRLKSRLSAERGSYGLFYYAGHGVQSGGENYLIPVDANIPSEAYLRDRSVSMSAALDELNAAGNTLNIIVLDACRDNPFGWRRSGTRGLQVVSNQPADSIIVYATSAGSTAADGTGRNGLFTTHLLNNLKKPGLSVRDMFDQTGADVRRTSGGAQIPAIYSQFFDVAYLGTRPAVVMPAPGPAVVQPAAPPVQPAPSPAKVYNIGDIGPAGGWIFYDKGSFSDGWRYLEAAPRDIDGEIVWGLLSKTVSATGTAVGSGKRNTQLILEALGREGETGKAAQLCAAFEEGGFKDWFLPSKDELDLMYKNLKSRGLGSFNSSFGWYWSSSERNSLLAWEQMFSDGNQYDVYKTDARSVRAVRAF
jgi:hypothetical protein